MSAADLRLDARPRDAGRTCSGIRACWAAWIELAETWTTTYASAISPRELPAASSPTPAIAGTAAATMNAARPARARSRSDTNPTTGWMRIAAASPTKEIRPIVVAGLASLARRSGRSRAVTPSVRKASGSHTTLMPIASRALTTPARS